MNLIGELVTTEKMAKAGHVSNQPVNILLSLLSFSSAVFLAGLIMVLMVMAGMSLALPEKAFAKPVPNKQILILSEGSYGLPFPDMVITGIVNELKRKKVSINDIFVEYLDFNRNPDTTYRINTINLLQHKLAQKQIGLIIAVNRNLLSSLVHEGKEFLPGVPVIGFGSPNDEPLAGERGRPTIEVLRNKDIVGTLRLARRLFPSTQRLIVVNATGSSSSVTTEEIKKAIDQVNPQLKVEYTEGLAYEQMLELVGSLPADTIILYGLYFRDITGRTFAPVDVAATLGQRSNAPVFCLDDIHMLKGLMGGSVASGSAIGKRVGELAFDYLNGDITLNHNKIQYQVPYTPLLNWPQVEQWKADFSQLPENVVFHNRPITFWQQYKRLVIGTAGALLLQAALIVALLIQNKRRKRAEQTVEKERQRLAGIISGTNVGTWEWHIPTGEIKVNDLWCEIIGYTLEEFPSLSFDTWTDLTHPDDLTRMREMLKRHFLGQIDHCQLELRIKHKDGSWKWVHSRGKVVSWADDGQPQVMMGTHQNISDRKQAEETIKHNELRLAKLVDILQHPTGTIQGLLDYTLEQLIDLTGSKIGYIYHFDEERKQFILSSWSKDVLPACAVANPQTCCELDKTGLWGEAVRQRRPLIMNDFQAANPLKKGYPEGHVPLAKFVTIPIFIDNCIVSVIGLANKETDYDETDVLQVTLLMNAVWKTIDRIQGEEEKKNLRLQLIQAQKMESLGTLAGGIAHDFNNILAAILGYSEMVQEQSPEGSTVRRNIDEVVRAGNRAKELVKQILAFSRQAEIDERVMQPAPIIHETIKMLRASLPMNIDIQHNIDPEAGPILANPTQLHQILTNLCTNASHAMEATGGSLTISLTNKELSTADLVSEPGVQPGRFTELSVGDTGPGIPPQLMRKIFDPFFTTKEVGKGTGMGLSIIHGIARKSGGCVFCKSSPGNGAIFHVYLPVLTDASLPEAENTVLDQLQRGNEHILFVDDEEMLAEMGKAILERLGYTVTVETSSIEALKIIEKQPGRFDLVITDQTMPGMTGSDLAQRMLQIRPDLPIILCTGFSSMVSADSAKGYGIKEFAMKPYAIKDFAVLVRKVLDGDK